MPLYVVVMSSYTIYCGVCGVILDVDWQAPPTIFSMLFFIYYILYALGIIKEILLIDLTTMGRCTMLINISSIRLGNIPEAYTRKVADKL